MSAQLLSSTTCGKSSTVERSGTVGVTRHILHCPHSNKTNRPIPTYTVSQATRPSPLEPQHLSLLPYTCYHSPWNCCQWQHRRTIFRSFSSPVLALSLSLSLSLSPSLPLPLPLPLPRSPSGLPYLLSYNLYLRHHTTSIHLTTTSLQLARLLYKGQHHYHLQQ